MTDRKKKTEEGKSTNPEFEENKVHPKQTRDDRTADAISELAEPFLKSDSKLSEVRFVYFMAVMAWNISLMDEKRKVKMKEAFVENLPKEMKLSDITSILNSMDRLAKLKTELFPDFKNLVVDHSVAVTDDKISLKVFTIPEGEDQEQDIR